MKKFTLGACSAVALMTIASGAQAHASGYTSGTFMANGPTAYSYNSKVVPPGRSGANVASLSGAGTVVNLNVWGLAPNKTYTAHGHVKPCGLDSAAAGGHWKKNTAIAGEIGSNELWFMFTTDAAGNGNRTAFRQFDLEPTPPKSIVIHGDGGVRIACITAQL